MNKGELVYVPAETTLQKKDKGGNVLTLLKVIKPTNLLVTEISEREYQVLFENVKWWVSKKDTYGVLE
tara:strand:- start:190 stop:393 length:204 start_codon:yes stop_codon:yes gene_type:complete